MRAFVLSIDDFDLTIDRIPGEPLTINDAKGEVVAEFIGRDRVVLSTRVCPDPRAHHPRPGLFRRMVGWFR